MAENSSNITRNDWEGKYTGIMTVSPKKAKFRPPNLQHQITSLKRSNILDVQRLKEGFPSYTGRAETMRDFLESIGDPKKSDHYRSQRNFQHERV